LVIKKIKVSTKLTIHEASVKQFNEIGTPIEVTEAFLKNFVPNEGELCAIYGKIGQGKTTLAVSMVKDWLMQGKVVYTSFPMYWDGYDQRKSFFWLFIGLLGFKRQYYEFPKENWHYLDCFADDVWDKMEKMTDCIIVFDDVIVQLFDSYEKTFFAKKKRQWAFFTRHFDRSIYLVTQRTSQIQVALRSQINRFYRCTKLISWPFILFRREEFQDMKDEDVNDDEGVIPDSITHVFGTNAIFKLFTSKYLRNGMPSSQVYHVNGVILSYPQKLLLIKNGLILLGKNFLQFLGSFKRAEIAKNSEIIEQVSQKDSLRDVLPF